MYYRIGLLALAFMVSGALMVAPVSAQLHLPSWFPCMGCDCDRDGYNAMFTWWGHRCCVQNCDCNDRNPDIHPGADEPCGSSIDYNCDGLSGAADADGDGTLDCTDRCPADPAKTDPGLCGCGVAEGCAAAPPAPIPEFPTLAIPALVLFGMGLVVVHLKMNRGR